MFIRIFMGLLALLCLLGIVSAAPLDINVREVDITSTNNSNTLLESFASPIR